MKSLRISLIVLSLLLLGTTTSNETVCQGFVPENDMKIAVSAEQVGGITEAQFTEVMNKIDAYYTPVIAGLGGRFVLNRKWTDPTVNAQARRSGTTYYVDMYGGLARHQVMTKDGMMLVACHEVGHHIGGAPKVTFFNSWASNEGQSDYYASLRCLRFMFQDEDNAGYVSQNEIDPVLRGKCEALYKTDNDKFMCMRIGMAGYVAGLVFQDLRKEPNPPRFDTPDQNRVSQTDDRHPGTQCRLDTYYQGDICIHDTKTGLSDSDANVGTCTLSGGSTDGVRPLCWFKP